MESVNDELTKPIYRNGKYENPWSTWRKITFAGIFSFWKNRVHRTLDKQILDKEIPVLKPKLEEFSSSTNEMKILWIGHATTLVQFDGVTVLTDPIFSNRCSPVWFMGPERIRPPPCTIEELPKVDLVVISHNHYDHLDYESVVALNRKFGDRLHWFVPMGLQNWLQDSGCKNVTEMTWWDTQPLPTKRDIQVVCTPCQHWSKRSVWDTDKTLWSSWVVKGPKQNFFFGGDTGYCAGFQQIGKKYGPFTLAAIPIGCYKPTSILSPQHVDPAQAVQIHLDVRAKNSIGIHWGTFNMMAYEQYWEPRDTLAEEAAKAHVPSETFITLRHGEIKTFQS